MRGLFRLLCLAAVAYGIYWYAMRSGCGTRGALDCPDPALEQGVGENIQAATVCPYAGYLCVGRSSFQVLRWPLDKGKLRVRITLPDFLEGDMAEQVREAAIEGIRMWEDKPFPLVIEKGGIPVRGWDINVIWTQGLFNGALGLNRHNWNVSGKRIDFSIDGLTVVVPPEAVLNAALLAHVKAVATHEMGHALGLGHSDSTSDIMYPTQTKEASLRASSRDFRSVKALYELPNGAMVQ